MSRNLPQDPERLARDLEARGWNLVRAWRAVVSLGPPDAKTARSYPFKHGFRGGWMAHEANPSLIADWMGPLLEAFQRFLADEGLSDAPARPDDVRSLMTGFATGVARRVEVLQEAGIWPAESAGLVVEWRGRTKGGRPRGGKAEVDDLAAFVEARYRAGWRELVVFRQGREVGAITRHPDTKRRSWYAEAGDR